MSIGSGNVISRLDILILAVISYLPVSFSRLNTHFSYQYSPIRGWMRT